MIYIGKSHRLNMELNLQSLFGLHVTWCAQLFSLTETPPPPPHWGSTSPCNSQGSIPPSFFISSPVSASAFLSQLFLILLPITGKASNTRYMFLIVVRLRVNSSLSLAHNSTRNFCWGIDPGFLFYVSVLDGSYLLHSTFYNLHR